ncbi:hypothetical protein E2C01_059469 [Portunus trituberculatus]|uniref:Uncharacterized protein n=1 Tax=Portunus trituberculatus TaxID=210409 RepID=A0A5B7H5X5_PORTR|nr:hypothetical protein [Portunus trituberculatus]
MIKKENKILPYRRVSWRAQYRQTTTNTEQLVALYVSASRCPVPCPQHMLDTVSWCRSLTWCSWERLRPSTSLPEEPEGKGREPQLKTPGRREGRSSVCGHRQTLFPGDPPPPAPT